MDRRTFIERVASLNLTRPEQAVALLWFYRQNQLFEERSISELADDLHSEGMGRPNVTELKKGLVRSHKVVAGKRKGTVQVNVKHLEELNRKFGPILNLKTVPATSSVLPADTAKGTRLYIEQMVAQINGSYDYGFYDSCAVLLRRLMESLIIEVFIHNNVADEIKADGKFLGLENLIKKICSRKDFHMSRSASGTMQDMKQLGDTAAHDRIYITQEQDIKDVRQEARKLIHELLVLSGVLK